MATELITETIALPSLFLAEPIFKVDSLNLLSTEPIFRYPEILKFLDLTVIRKLKDFQENDSFKYQQQLKIEFSGSLLFKF